MNNEERKKLGNLRRISNRMMIGNAIWKNSNLSYKLVKVSLKLSAKRLLIDRTEKPVFVPKARIEQLSSINGRLLRTPKKKRESIQKKFRTGVQAIYKVLVSYFDGLRKKYFTKQVIVRGYNKKELLLKDTSRFKMKDSYNHLLSVVSAVRVA